MIMFPHDIISFYDFTLVTVVLMLCQHAVYVLLEPTITDIINAMRNTIRDMVSAGTVHGIPIYPNQSDVAWRILTIANWVLIAAMFYFIIYGVR